MSMLIRSRRVNVKPLPFGCGLDEPKPRRGRLEDGHTYTGRDGFVYRWSDLMQRFDVVQSPVPKAGPWRDERDAYGNKLPVRPSPEERAEASAMFDSTWAEDLIAAAEAFEEEARDEVWAEMRARELAEAESNAITPQWAW